MRTYKEIPIEELLTIVKETISFYLLSEIVEARKEKDLKHLQDVCILIDEILPKLDSKAGEIIHYINCEPDESFDVFEDLMFQAIENLVI